MGPSQCTFGKQCSSQRTIAQAKVKWECAYCLQVTAKRPNEARKKVSGGGVEDEDT